MKRRRVILVVLAIALIAGAVIAFFAVRTEPSYQGRRIGAWLDDYINADPMSSFDRNRAQRQIHVELEIRRRAEVALREIGIDGIPYILRRVALADSTWHKKYEAWRPNAPAWVKRHLPEPRIPLAATSAGSLFYGMGTNAFPSLIEAFKDTNPLVREAAVFGVETLIHYEPQKISQPEMLIPELIPLVNDPAENVRRFAAGGLGKLGPAASNAVPVLSAALDEPSARHPNLTAWIATALGKIGPASRVALPRLKVLLKDPDPYLRSEAAAAVWRIDGDVDTALVVLIEELPKSNVNSKWEWIEAMAEMGPRASNAFGALVMELPGATGYNREKITNALYKIDPETSAATWGK